MFDPLKHLSSMIVGPAGALLFLFFFLPWVTVSCSGTNLIDASGYDLASGNALDEAEAEFADLDSMFTEDFESTEGVTITPSAGTITTDNATAESEVLDADAVVWLILVGAVITLGALAARYYAGIGGVAAGIAYVFAGIMGMAAFLMKYMDLEDLRDAVNDANNEGGGMSFTIVDFSYEIGFYLTGLALVLIIIAGLLAILIEPAAETTGQPPPPPDFTPSWE